MSSKPKPEIFQKHYPPNDHRSGLRPRPPMPSGLETVNDRLRKLQLRENEANGDDNSRNFGRQNNSSRSNPNPPPSRANTSSPSANSPSALYSPGGVPPSPSQATNVMSVNEQAFQGNQGAKRTPLFFRDDYVGFIVKGNFMTLGAKPALVEEGEWMAHQIVEQNRLLTGMLKVVQTEDRTNGAGLCNEKTCPTMHAGPNTTYTWIDTNRNPINLPAHTYIKHIQTWIAGKIQDETVFPTATFQQAPTWQTPQQAASDPSNWLGKTSGFPQRFETEIKNMYKQMFRCYAHLYWGHWLDYWHLNCYRDLNTCFIHFVNVGRVFGLLTDRDTEPMQPLIELWIHRGDLPNDKAAEVGGQSQSQSQNPSQSSQGNGGESSTDAAAAGAPAAPPTA